MGSSAGDKQRERCRCEAVPQGDTHGSIGPSEVIACNQRTFGGSDDGSDGGGVQSAIKCAVDNSRSSARDDGGDYTEGGGTSAGGSESVGECGISYGGAGGSDGGAKGESPHSPRDSQGAPLEAPDGGWGWMVALGSALIMMLIPIMGPLFGVLFSRYLLDSGASSITTAWIFNTQCFLWNTSSLLSRPLTREFGWRRVGVAGALTASVGFMAGSFAPAPEYLFFSYSVLCGTGGGIVTTMCFFIVPLYFDRWRGVANGIMMAGVGAGQILGPPFTRWLQDQYGYRGATLIIGALMLHGCVAAFLFHPVEWHLKPRPQVEEELGGGKRLILEKTAKNASRETQESNTRSSLLGVFVRIARSTASDLGVLRSARACIICFAATLCLNSNLNFIMMVPFAIQDAGHSLDFAAWCLSVKAVCNMLTRLVVSPLTDWSKFSVRGCYVAGFGVVAITTFIFPLVQSPTWLLVTSAIYGCGIGANMSIHSLVIIDVVGLERLPSVYGTYCFVSALGFISFGPLIGLVQDTWDSYLVSMWVLSAMLLVSIALWLFMGLATRYDLRKKQQQ